MLDPVWRDVTQALREATGPFIAATDWMKLVPDQVARWVPGLFVPLGTDGFGLSDTRPALRRHFEVDAPSIVIAALDALRQQGSMGADVVGDAIAQLGIDPDKLDAATV